MRKLTILIIGLTLTITSCKDCICTKKGCDCAELIIKIEANVDNDVEGSYTEQEIDNFYLIRTDTGFGVIDSLKLEFGQIVGNIDYNRFYWVNQNAFSDFNNFRSYNLLIKNTVLNSTDTITAIDYTEKMDRVLCNTCLNCDDEYITCMHYSNLSLEFNAALQDNFNVRIEK
jgi:hypothetical protein